MLPNHFSEVNKCIYSNAAAGANKRITDKNVCELLGEHCADALNTILKEMEFWLNMTTCKTTKKHLFSPRNRGAAKMKSLIDISYGQIEKLALPIAVPLNSLHGARRQLVFDWMYDECQKKCEEFQWKKLIRADRFFETLFQSCENELNDRKKTYLDAQSATTPSKKYSNSNPLHVYPHDSAPPPYTSPTCDSFAQNSFFKVPTSVPQRLIAVSQQQTQQRPMTAPVQYMPSASTNSYNSTTTTLNGNVSTPYSGPIHSFVPIQNVTSTHTLLQSTTQQATVVTQNQPVYQFMDATNVVPECQPMIYTTNDSASAYDAMPIRRQSNENAYSYVDSPNSRKRQFTSLSTDASGIKISRNESFGNAADEQSYTLRYGNIECNGTQTPRINMILEMNDLVTFNNSTPTSSATQSNNVQVQSDRMNDLYTPVQRQSDFCYDSRSIEQIVNDELQLGADVMQMETEVMNSAMDTAEVIVETTHSNSSANAEPAAHDISIPLPSMPNIPCDTDTSDADAETTNAGGEEYVVTFPAEPQSAPNTEAADEKESAESPPEISTAVVKEEPKESADDAQCSSSTPSTRRKCKRFVDLTEDSDDGGDSDVVIVESDEDEDQGFEEKFKKFQCVRCSELAKFICVKCFCRTYCSKFCQEVDEPDHSAKCDGLVDKIVMPKPKE